VAAHLLGHRERVVRAAFTEQVSRPRDADAMRASHGASRTSGRGANSIYVIRVRVSRLALYDLAIDAARTGAEGRESLRRRVIEFPPYQIYQKSPAAICIRPAVRPAPLIAQIEMGFGR